MKLLIGIGLMSLMAVGCSSAKHARESAPTTEPVAEVDKKPAMLMEHRLVEIKVELATAEPTTRPNRYPIQARWTSATTETEFAFTELLPSWNVTVPENAGVRWDVRVRDVKTKQWSDWLYIGYWGRVTRDHRKTEFEGGEVDVDTLRLTSPANAFELRATTMSFDLEKPALPKVRALQAVYSRPLEGELKESAEKLPARVDLPVPYRAQGVENKCISGSICSPTSTSMVMQWAGVDRPTQTNALAIWDDDYAIFGNWNRAVQYAASMGLEARLERFTTIHQVHTRLAQGQPIIASINFEPGTFPSNVMNSTDGHLIVIRGYTESGDLIVNDPASKDRGNGIIYKANELAHAWLVNTGGVGYIIKKPDNKAVMP